MIIQEDLEDFDDLVYSIYSNSPIKCFAQLHNILDMGPHNEELQQCLDIFVKDA